MESANIHHYLHGVQPPPPSSYGLGTTLHAWSTTPNSILNTNGTGFNNNSYSNEIPRQQQQENTNCLISSANSQYLNPIMSTTPDLNYNWVNNFTTNINQSPPPPQEDHLQQLSRIKEELAVANRYYTEELLLSSSPTSNTVDELSLRSSNHQQLHKSFSSNNLNKSHQAHFYSSDDDGRGAGFTQINLPSHVNVSDLGGSTNNNNNTTSGSNFNMNLQALDLLTSSRFAPSYGFHNMVQSHQLPLYSSKKISAPSNNNGGAESKRNSSKMEQAPKAQQTTATKKSRVEARASCPPFKVRKEKLGDRIAALQQLVAPFGKTDTASVLMEAIGYIKFLQNQVETLSVPYMKASRDKTSRVIKGVATDQNENYEESKRDLKSRGLCLVPLSCLSYIADGGGAAVWPPPHFGGATI
ncbi:hypothetical protein ACJIZ3_024879 [Penstemon smallii]|uniref:BHLH domain-containing protein n=1 Tax=Penstemon smallii TaxID=265156 RepID=A0ABD3TWF2_9LAMI